MPLDGWIKMQKSLREDRRVWRIARALRERHADRHASVTEAVTLTIGALAVLWMHADTFAGEDDALELTPDEINELTGVEGFAELLPADWLEVLDPQRVKLPGFQEHNGPIAVRRAMDARRAAKYRDAQRDARRTVVTASREHPRLDDTRQDETRPKRGNGGEAHPPPNPLSYHGSLPTEAWAQWLEHRRKRKWPVDPRTLGIQLALLAKHTKEEQQAMIETSIQSGWQGLFAPKGPSKPQAPKPSTWKPPEDDPDVHH